MKSSVDLGVIHPHDWGIFRVAEVVKYGDFHYAPPANQEFFVLLVGYQIKRGCREGYMGEGYPRVGKYPCLQSIYAISTLQCLKSDIEQSRH